MDTLDEVLDLLEAEAAGVVRPCPVAALLAGLPTETANRLARVLDGKQSTRKIHAQLSAAGIKVGRDSLSAHRSGYCRCQNAVSA